MSAPESITTPRSLNRIAILVAVAIGLLAPMAGLIGGYHGDVAALEFREPALLPEIPRNAEKLRAFPSEMDAFLEDHFGFRSQLLALNSRLHVAIGVSSLPRLMLGKEGWLFHRTPDRVLDQYRGIDRFSPTELERWVLTMERRQRWLAKRGIRMLITIAPTKHAIYPEYVPDWANVVNREGRYQQLVARLAMGSPLELVDLHAPLLEAKLEHRVYHRTDTHWNELGAHAAYATIVERVRESHPEVPLRSVDWFDLEWILEPFGGHARALNISENMLEELPRLQPRSGTRVVRRVWPDRIPDDPINELFFTQVIESDLSGQPTVVFVRDSFATNLSLFAQESFRRTVLIHHGFGGFPRELILSYEPDIVVFEMIEAGLAWEQK
ncbi:MAG: hypothetical protein AAEJ52_12840 [Myxococcota bacterium]